MDHNTNLYPSQALSWRDTQMKEPDIVIRCMHSKFLVAAYHFLKILLLSCLKQQCQQQVDIRRSPSASDEREPDQTQWLPVEPAEKVLCRPHSRRQIHHWEAVVKDLLFRQTLSGRRVTCHQVDFTQGSNGSETTLKLLWFNRNDSPHLFELETMLDDSSEQDMEQHRTEGENPSFPGHRATCNSNCLDNEVLG